MFITCSKTDAVHM